MNTAADCAKRYHDPLLQVRHLRLLHALKAAGIQATCGDDDQWMVTMPSARYYGWISFKEMLPPEGEWVVAVPRDPAHPMRVLQRIPPEKGGWDMQDAQHAVHYSNDYIFWMVKP